MRDYFFRGTRTQQIASVKYDLSVRKIIIDHLFNLCCLQTVIIVLRTEKRSAKIFGKVMRPGFQEIGTQGDSS